MPAGFLHSLFYYSGGDDAVNYGAVGVDIAHELTHNFDNGGRKIDAQGNLRDWWTDSDAREFEARAECFVEEFNSSTVVGVKVSGRATLDENIADSGGLYIAYNALMSKLAQGSKASSDGFSPEQRFFLAYAQMWPEILTPQTQLLQGNTEGHAPQILRVNLQLSNMKEFESAFHCSSAGPMVRKNRCRIW